MKQTIKKAKQQSIKIFGLMKKKALSTLSQDEGQGISEYLIILAVVVIAAIALATTFSDQLTALWASITSQLTAIS